MVAYQVQDETDWKFSIIKDSNCYETEKEAKAGKKKCLK